MKKNGFQQRLMISTTLVVAIICILNFTLYRVAYDRQSEFIFDNISTSIETSVAKKQEEQANILANILSNQLFDPLYHLNISEITHLLETNLNQPFVEAINIVGVNGLIVHDGTTELANFGKQHTQQALIQTVINNNKRIKQYLDNKLIIASPIGTSNNLIGVLYIELNSKSFTQSLKNSKDDLLDIDKINKSKMLQWQLLFSIIPLILGGFMAYTIGHSFSNPLNNIIHQLRKINKRELTPLTSIGSYKEFNHLVSAFNNLQSSVAKRTQYIEHMAFHDQHSGLPNRGRVTELIDEQIEANNDTKFAVLFIDLDNFKYINENYGHDIGDQLIIRIIEIINTTCLSYSESDFSIHLARVGVDEFILSIPTKTEEETKNFTQCLLSSVAQSIDFEQFQVSISASIGIAMYPDFGSTAELLCRHAELAMMEQKEKGHNEFSIYTSEMHAAIEERNYIEKELRKAMDDLSQFELWYQPKFDVSNSGIIGAEALVRWKHPERGYIWPDQFIPLAESTDMILSLGEYLISMAAQQASDWRTLFNDDFYIALNLSPRQLYRQDVVGIISSALSKHDLPSYSLHVEVTETLLMSDSEHIKDVISELSDMGITVWLDDFGTGYSSLSYLQKYKFDGVKIDRSFISSLSPENDNSSLIEAILSMSSSLNMANVAEGIETEYQRQKLDELGCAYGQGYLISRPLPAVQFQCTFAQ